MKVRTLHVQRLQRLDRGTSKTHTQPKKTAQTRLVQSVHVGLDAQNDQSDEICKSVPKSPAAGVREHEMTETAAMALACEPSGNFAHTRMVF